MCYFSIKYAHNDFWFRFLTLDFWWKLLSRLKTCPPPNKSRNWNTEKPVEILQHELKSGKVTAWCALHAIGKRVYTTEIMKQADQSTNIKFRAFTFVHKLNISHRTHFSCIMKLPIILIASSAPRLTNFFLIYGLKFMAQQADLQNHPT